MIRVILLILYLGQFQSHPGDHETRNALRRPVWQFIAAEPPGNYPALATCLHIARPVAMAPVAPPSADSRSWAQAYADQRDLLGCVSFPRRHRRLSLAAQLMGGRLSLNPAQRAGVTSLLAPMPAVMGEGLKPLTTSQTPRENSKSATGSADNPAKGVCCPIRPNITAR